MLPANCATAQLPTELKTIKLHQNVRNLKIVMFIAVFLAFFQVYGIRKEGLQTEHILILSVCGALWIAAFLMVRNKEPYLILSASGFSMRERNSKLILWEEVYEMELRRENRTTRLRIKTKHGEKNVIARMITWNISDLAPVMETLRSSTFDEREKLIQTILEQEAQQ